MYSLSVLKTTLCNAVYHNTGDSLFTKHYFIACKHVTTEITHQGQFGAAVGFISEENGRYFRMCIKHYYGIKHCCLLWYLYNAVYCGIFYDARTAEISRSRQKRYFCHTTSCFGRWLLIIHSFNFGFSLRSTVLVVPFFQRLFPSSNGSSPLPTALPTALAFFQWLFPSSNGSSLLPTALPFFQWLFPSSNGSSLLPTAHPFFQRFFPSSNGSSLLPTAIPFFQRLFPSSNGSSPLPTALPLFQWLFPSSNGSSPLPTALPFFQRLFPSSTALPLFQRLFPSSNGSSPLPTTIIPYFKLFSLLLSVVVPFLFNLCCSLFQTTIVFFSFPNLCCSPLPFVVVP